MTRRTDRARVGTRPAELRAHVRRALHEDRALDDRTSAALIPAGLRARGYVVAQARGVVSGIQPAREVARTMGLTILRSAADGARVKSGTVVLELEGNARRLLSAERTLLNYLMHLSGVASETRRAVVAARGRLVVLATRKTIPGLRDLEKSAVVHGGGRPHRRDLSAAVLIKNNHLALVRVPRSLRTTRGGSALGRAQVEVRSLADARRAINAGARSLLVDNLSPQRARSLIEGLRRERLREGVWIELSGGITPETVGRYRATGADAVSLGALTHSARALPFHLIVTPGPLRRRRPR